MLFYRARETLALLTTDWSVFLSQLLLFMFNDIDQSNSGKRKITTKQKRFDFEFCGGAELPWNFVLKLPNFV